MAQTLVYDVTITSDLALPAELGSITVPTLVLSGTESPAWMRDAAQSVADAVADGRHSSLASQTHDLVPEVLAPVLEEFFTATR